MSIARLRSIRRTWPLLLWLALALPFAQSVAQWHTLSHHAAAIGGGERDSGLSPSSCELCLGAAGVAAGALAAASMAWLLPDTVAAAPMPGGEQSAAIARPPPYRSRAPPLAAR